MYCSDHPPLPPPHDWLPPPLTYLFTLQVLLTLQPVPPWMMTTAGTWMRTRSGKLSGATCRRGATLTWPTSSLLCLPRLVLGSSFIKQKIKIQKAKYLMNQEFGVLFYLINIETIIYLLY